MQSLSVGNICRGVGKCYDNAQEYLEEAKILFREKHTRRASALAILGLEEVGKMEVLGSAALLKVGDIKQWDQFWTNFTSHIAKQARGLFTSMDEIASRYGKRNLLDTLPVTVSGRDGANPMIDFETIKQQCFYVGYDVAAGEFKLLKIDSEVCWKFITILEAGLKKFRPLSNFGTCKKIVERFKDEKYVEMANKNLQERKRALLQYLEQEGFPSPKTKI